MKPTITTPAAVRLTLTETIEDIGTVMTLLREADTDETSDNHLR